MKKLLTILMFITPLAYADKWLESSNNANGKIVLLQSDCDNTGKGKLILSSSETGQSIRGCWWYFAGQIHVVYVDGSTYAYDPKNFIIREEK